MVQSLTYRLSAHKNIYTDTPGSHLRFYIPLYSGLAMMRLSGEYSQRYLILNIKCRAKFLVQLSFYCSIFSKFSSATIVPLDSFLQILQCDYN